MRLGIALALVCSPVISAGAETGSTALWERGYSVIPTPRNVTLGAADVVFEGGWRAEAGALPDTHIALRTLREGLAEFHGVQLQLASSRVIRLAVRQGAVAVEGDPLLIPQAYRLTISPLSIDITANGEPGLFYGVQTLVQLLRRDTARNRLILPEVTIEDWPRLPLRFLHWDSKHHQDRMATMKQYLDWSARMKVNMIGFELEDKFAYPSNPEIGAPGAFTAAQLQEIVDYGLERFIQVVPVVQSPAHLAFVLKHPRFAHLKADGNNYQACLCDEDAYKLIFSMYDDVIAATKGVDYFFVSTDEVYYAGICAKCGQPYNDETRSLKWIEFAKRAHDHLAARGRRMLAWVEYPVLDKHIPMLPPDLIDGVMGEPEYAPHEKAMGMRQLIYTSTQGAEYLFPDHLPDMSEAPTGEFERGLPSGRLRSTFQDLAGSRIWQVNPIGAFAAAWDDSGLHSETFWLGWSAVAQYAWTPATPPVEQHAAEFMRLYYGSRSEGMLEVYSLLQAQTRAWQRLWDRSVSRVRKAGYGNSYGKGIGTTRYDLTLTPPPLPRAADLAVAPTFIKTYSKFIAEARPRINESERLIHALQAQMGAAERNRYALEVFSSLARFAGHHFRLVTGLAAAERSFQAAAASSRARKHADAVASLVGAHGRMSRLDDEGVASFQQLTTVFEKSRFPKGQTVGGRSFVHVLDDTKDHFADRTADLGYMYAPEQSIGLKQWLKDLEAVIRIYAKAHNVPVKGLAETRLEE